MFRTRVSKIAAGISCISTAATGYTCYKLNSLKFEQKLNIVFDLDDTLIDAHKFSHIEDENLDDIRKCDTIAGKYHVWKRPYCNSVLWLLSKFTNMYLFTRATKPYADDITNGLNIRKYFIECYYRDSCTECKDMSLCCKNLNLSLLVDNDKSNKCDDQQLYHIKSYYFGYKYDIELLKLLFKVILLSL
jgi:TFIIF-interacting CTD phosphatase-like protein